MNLPPIAMLHHVEDRQDWASLQPFCIKRATFIRFLDQIEQSGKKGVTMSDAIANPNRKNVVLTFDDGAQHLWDFAIPELSNRGMRASFYIPTQHIGKTNTWDIAENRAEVKIMDEHHIRELQKLGMEIGGHSHHHSKLGELSSSKILQELRSSKEILDNIVGQESQTMAWPYGSVPINAKDLLDQAKWKFGLSIFSRKQCNASLRRFIVHDGDSSVSLFLKLSRSYQVYRGITDYLK